MDLCTLNHLIFIDRHLPSYAKQTSFELHLHVCLNFIRGCSVYKCYENPHYTKINGYLTEFSPINFTRKANAVHYFCNFPKCVLMYSSLPFFSRCRNQNPDVCAPVVSVCCFSSAIRQLCMYGGPDITSL